jgi:16S rRNA (guanine966-N2)-methyltransferase
MRIIAGSLKGRSIDVPKNFKGRPTTDFAREGLFNVLNNRVNWNQTKVLDLFAGTGAFSLECFSRGSDTILAVDLQPLHTRFIKQDVFKWIPTCSETFDLIFADPPYDLPGLTKLPRLILEKGLLNPEGVLIVEHGKRTDLSQIQGFMFEKTYSNVTFSFFQN